MTGWELLKPTAVSMSCLDEISEFRGRVLYENGRRPAFRLPTGRFADPDPLDPQAYHIIGRNDRNFIGCVRNVPLTPGVTCLTEHLLGETQFAQTLATLGVARKDVVEASRWMVDADFRTFGLGVGLAACSVAVARAFGFRLLVCSVGTRNKQDRVLAHLGLRRVPALPLIPVPEFNDDLCVMSIQPQHPTPHLAQLMAEMEMALKLKPARKSKRQATGAQASPLAMSARARKSLP